MKSILIKLFFITLGAFIASVALSCFLVPNNLIDGGTVGLSIIAAYLLKPGIGFFLLVLNIPFLAMAYRRLGRTFVVLTFYAICMFALFTTLGHAYFEVVTKDLVLDAVFGGFILGLGVGLVLRNGASLDGTEILALCFNKKIGYSVGEIIMFINVFIFFLAGFVFGWDRAMYSALTYIVAYNVIDAVLQGLSESKSLLIVSDKYKELGDHLMKELQVAITYISATGGYLGIKKEIIYCVVPRFMIVKIKDVINEIDPEAFLAIENVHEVEGKSYRNKKHA